MQAQLVTVALLGRCYQNTSGGALETFSPGIASMLLVHRGYASSTASSMETGTPPPGTYNVGFCVDNLSGVEPLDQNWAVNGWVQATNRPQLECGVPTRGRWRVEGVKFEDYIERMHAETAGWVRARPFTDAWDYV